MDLRIAIEGDGALGVAVRQGLVPLLDQRPMVDALGAASALKGAVRAVGPVLAPGHQVLFLVPRADSCSRSPPG